MMVCMFFITSCSDLTAHVKDTPPKKHTSVWCSYNDFIYLSEIRNNHSMVIIWPVHVHVRVCTCLCAIVRAREGLIFGFLF